MDSMRESTSIFGGIKSEAMQRELKNRALMTLKKPVADRSIPSLFELAALSPPEDHLSIGEQIE